MQQQPQREPEPVTAVIRRWSALVGDVLQRAATAIARRLARAWAAFSPFARRALELIGRVFVGAGYALWRRTPRLRSTARPQGLGVIVAQHDDDAASIIGRIDTAEEVDLVLVVPRSARGLRDETAWPHIAAHVRRHGIALGVAAARRSVRLTAADNGLRAAGSLRALRRQRTRRLRVGAREFELSGFRLFGFVRWLTVPLVFAGAAAGICYSVPSAEIVIVPPSQVFARTVAVRIDPVADGTDVAGGVLPGVTVRQTFSIVLATDTTGSTDVGDEPATVELRVQNGGDAPLLIAAGAFVVNENGIAFTVDEETAVPAGEAVTVVATAERAGEIGNLDAGETWTLSGVPESVNVTNPGPAQGGTNRAVAAVAIEDVERLRALASEVLIRVGARQLEATVESGTVLTETAIVTLLGEEPFENLGAAVDVFLMEFSAVVSALTISHADAEAFGEQLLRAALPAGQALLPGTTKVEFGDDRSYEAGEVALTLTATGLVFDLFEPALIQEGLTGARPSTAAAALQQRLGLVEAPSISLRPQWLPWVWLPQRGSQISITFDGPPVAEEEDAE